MKTLAQLIAAHGIDEKHAISLMNNRARYHQRKDRPKVFAGTDVGSIPRTRWNAENEIQFDMTSLRIPESTRDYVTAWCRLNHLKG
jgi:hypothetical protein